MADRRDQYWDRINRVAGWAAENPREAYRLARGAYNTVGTMRGALTNYYAKRPRGEPAPTYAPMYANPIGPMPYTIRRGPMKTDQGKYKKSKRFNIVNEWVHYTRYEPILRIDKSLQPLIQWKEFQKGAVIKSQDGKQAVSMNIYDVHLPLAKLQKVYNKIHTDVFAVANNIKSTNTIGVIENVPVSSTAATNLPPLLCHGATRHWTFMNTSTVAGYLEMWEMRYTNEDNLASPITLWDLDLLDNSNTGIGTMPLNTQQPGLSKGYDITLYDPHRRPDKRCKNLWQAYQCIGKHKLTIPAGKVMTLSTGIPGFAVSHNKLFDQGNIQSATWESGVFEQMTTQFVFFLQGPMVYDNATGAQPMGKAPVSISYKYVDHYRYSMPIRARTRYELTTNINWETEEDYGPQYPFIEDPAVVEPAYNIPTQRTCEAAMDEDAV